MVNIKHSLGTNGNIISITDVDSANRGKYSCIQCNGELIARMGEIREHHFAHKHTTANCSYESYLHLIAKKKFYQKYTECLTSNSPFYLEFEQERKCVTCLNIPGLKKSCELDPVKRKLDLTKYFDQVIIEQRHSGFIADVLLKSSKREEVLFVEFVVTHSCEREKLSSGVRIIEIDLVDEEDLKFIDKGLISHLNPNITYYNFKNGKDIGDHLDEETCEKMFSILTVSKQGTAHLNEVNLKQLNQRLKSKNVLKSKVLDPELSLESNGAEYKRFVRESSLDGIQVKNCYACRFGASNGNHSINERTFCKKKKIGVSSSNEAKACSDFWRIDKDFEETRYNRRKTWFSHFWD